MLETSWISEGLNRPLKDTVQLKYLLSGGVLLPITHRILPNFLLARMTPHADQRVWYSAFFWWRGTFIRHWDTLEPASFFYLLPGAHNLARNEVLYTFSLDWCASEVSESNQTLFYLFKIFSRQKCLRAYESENIFGPHSQMVYIYIVLQCVPNFGSRS